jgi:hypothetical protein
MTGQGAPFAILKPKNRKTEKPKKNNGMWLLCTSLSLFLSLPKVVLSF